MALGRMGCGLGFMTLRFSSGLRIHGFINREALAELFQPSDLCTAGCSVLIVLVTVWGRS